MTLRSCALLLAIALFAAGPTVAGDMLLVLDPERSRVDWVLDATAHKVRGSFAVREGRVRVDPATGGASGEIVVDATSAETGNQRRDRKMHDQVLESDRYPSFLLRPERIDGTLAANGTSELTIHGTMTVRGIDHPVSIATVATINGERATARATFRVPFVEWGMRDPSVFVLRVAKQVDVTVVVEGTLDVDRGP